MFIYSRSTSTNSISKTELLVALELLEKMCQQSNALLPDTDWHRLMQHNKILTDAHNARRLYTHAERANANTITCTLPYKKKYDVRAGAVFAKHHLSHYYNHFYHRSCQLFLRSMSSIYYCLLAVLVQSCCKSISGMQFQNRWYFNHFPDACITFLVYFSAFSFPLFWHSFSLC